MAQVLVTDRIGEEGLGILRRGAGVDVRLGLSPAELLEAIPDYDALAVRSETKVTAEVLAAGRKLVVVGRAGVGVDNIDVEAATTRGIVVVNAPAAITIATAEHTLGMMLALARHIPFAHASLTSGKWERSKFVGVELRGKTLGIAGLGRIGAEVARRARALEMRVIAFDPFVTPERFQSMGITLASLDELLAESDFITLHLPLTAANHHFLDDEQFAKLKPGARILNVARGELVSEAALLRALDAGRIAGAAIDVFEKEPPDPESPLLHHANVVVTPHLGASAAEAQERLSVDVAEQLLTALRGEPVVYAVNAPFIAAEAFKVIAPFLHVATQTGSLATQLSTGQLESIAIEYEGEVAEHETAPLKSAVIRGLLAPVSEENITLINAGLVAEQRGLRITERKGDHQSIYKDLISVRLKTSSGETSVSGTLAHDGPHIVEINDFWVDVSPGEGYLLLVENVDRPGMIGRIGSMLGEKGVNISFMRVGRSSEAGRALMVLGLDDAADGKTIAAIAAIPDIFSVRAAKI
ncbi:MAG TPA: phosphoglycerate dehydrogenase [Dehalococcoidia bacterium]|nr:phosphoglycerate dehydrogenase [Dehalococcoidia bacterium]